MANLRLAMTTYSETAKSMKANTMNGNGTKFTALSQSARSQFFDRWYYLQEMVKKWQPETAPGFVIPVFGNIKALEKEIEDLEDVSLSAYRAMKLLKLQLEELHSAYNLYCACGRDLTDVGYLLIRGEYYCNHDCLAKYQPSENNKSYICAECNTTVNTSYIECYGKHFCDTDCMMKWEQDYAPANYAG